MSKNLTRKGLALGTAFAFVATGLTGIAPATAAAGDVVSIAPSVGTGWGVYNTDWFSTTISLDTDVVTQSAYEKLAIKVESKDESGTLFSLDSGVTIVGPNTTNDVAGVGQNLNDCTYSVDAALFDASGNATEATLATEVTLQVAATALSCNTSDVSLASFFIDGTYPVAVIKPFENGPEATLWLQASDAADKTVNAERAVTAWIDSDSNSELDAIKDKYPSKTETVTFFDPANVTVTPRIERFVPNTGAPVLNADGDAALGASLEFTSGINLDQIWIGNGSAFTFSALESGQAGQTANTFTPAPLAGNLEGLIEVHSPAGKIYGVLTHSTPASFGLDKGKAYTFEATRTDAAQHLTTTNTADDAVDYTTAGFTVPVQASVGITAIAKALVDQTADSEQASNTATAIKLRAGVKKFTYTSEGTYAAGATASNVPVIALVRAVDLASGSTLTAGTSKLTEGQAALVSGVTDADGKFSVSVESSSAKAGEDYSVVFYALLNDGTYVNTGTFAPAYEAASASVMTQASAILAGSTVDAKFTLKDQFGKVVSANASGTAYTVRLQAPDTTKLKKYATFVNGEATVSFTNFLSKGQSATLNAQIGTGVDSAFAAVTGITGGANLSPVLYNPEDAAAVNTVATLSAKEITYDAFITGAAGTANVAPAAGDAFLLTGTVVDTTGAGIPGAVVTVSATGLQFVKSASGIASGDYALDTITVTADAAGSYEVSAWAHKVSSAGIVITTTSGGKSATTKVVTTANGSTVATGDAITADDLVFTWDAPAKMVVDTTYVVTAKVADKWGNPVKGANIDFSADGAIEVNSNTAVSDKLTNDSGIVRVYVRSLDKTTGVGTFTATLDTVTIAGTTLNNGGTAPDVSEWAAAKTFANVLSADLDVVASIAPVAVANASGSTDKVFVSVTNAAGKKVVVKVSGKFAKSFTGTAAKKTVAVAALKGKRTVTIFVGGVLVSTKVVTIK